MNNFWRGTFTVLALLMVYLVVGISVLVLSSKDDCSSNNTNSQQKQKQTFKCFFSPRNATELKMIPTHHATASTAVLGKNDSAVFIIKNVKQQIRNHNKTTTMDDLTTTGITTTSSGSSHGPPPPPLQNPKIIFLVQGQQHLLKTWNTWIQNVVNNNNNNNNVTDYKVLLVYASFDKPSLDDNNANDDDGIMDCHEYAYCRTLYIPNTTWTSGRNELVKFAICEEERRNETFEAWIFADDDVELVCTTTTTTSTSSSSQRHDDAKHTKTTTTASSSLLETTTELMNNQTACWKRYFEVLLPHFLQTSSSSSSSSSSPVIMAVREYNKKQKEFQKNPFSFYLTGQFDAILNAFRRQHVQQLLPYPFMPDRTPWWTSQMVLWRLLEECFGKFSTVIPMEMAYVNLQHRPYPKGMNRKVAAAMYKSNYYKYLGKVENLQITSSQFHDFLGPHDSWDDVTVSISKQQQQQSSINTTTTTSGIHPHCFKLEQERFAIWKASWGSCPRFQQEQERLIQNYINRKTTTRTKKNNS